MEWTSIVFYCNKWRRIDDSIDLIAYFVLVWELARLINKITKHMRDWVQWGISIWKKNRTQLVNITWLVSPNVHHMRKHLVIMPNNAFALTIVKIYVRLQTVMAAPTSDGLPQTSMVWYAIVRKYNVACGFADATINFAR